MHTIGLNPQGEGREADLIRDAVSNVLQADVISRATKRSLLARLAVLKTALDCADNACRGCSNRSDCANLVEGILASN